MILAHVSDLHFGRHDPEVADALIRDLRAAAPTLVVVSGDVTQRATTRQFRAFRAWLDALSLPWLAVPGNHDVPLVDLLRRALSPWSSWRRHVSDDLTPFFQDAAVAVLGVNTARRSRWKEGRISREQMRLVEARLGPSAGERLRVLVTHHPFLPAPQDRSWTPMGRAEEAVAILVRSGVDLLLSGHQHRAYSADVETHVEKMARGLLVAHAGTSTSVRRRGEPNTWNLVRHVPPFLEIGVRTFADGRFGSTGVKRFRREGDRWRTEPPVA